MTLSDKDISVIKDFFSDKPVLKAYLFGSYARNQGDSGSDVDILVDLDYSTHIGLGFIKMKFDLEQRLNEKVDLVSSVGISPFIQPFVEKDKQLIYER